MQGTEYEPRHAAGTDHALSACGDPGYVGRHREPASYSAEYERAVLWGIAHPFAALRAGEVTP